MTKKITVSLPDDVAARLKQEKNISAFVADAVRRRMSSEGMDALLARAGIVVTPEGKARARAKLAAARAANTPERREQLRQTIAKITAR